MGHSALVQEYACRHNRRQKVSQSGHGQRGRRDLHGQRQCVCGHEKKFTVDSGQWSVTSLVPQRLNRVQVRGFPRRIDAEE